MRVHIEREEARSAERRRRSLELEVEWAWRRRGWVVLACASALLAWWLV